MEDIKQLCGESNETMDVIIQSKHTTDGETTTTTTDDVTEDTIQSTEEEHKKQRLNNNFILPMVSLFLVIFNIDLHVFRSAGF